jgi:putative tryptophan/tyrosine transport system substrate-binding protein
LKIKHIGIWVFCLLIWLGPVWAQSAQPKVCVVVSREIRPFVLMADELEADLVFSSTRVYLDDMYRTYGENGKLLEIDKTDFSLFIAVGPRALAFLLEQNVPARIIYGMVLNPESFVQDSRRQVSGVSLNIFSLTQLSYVKKVFPDIKRIGVLYDPEHNQNWFNKARFFANAQQIELVSMAVSDKSDITGVLKTNIRHVDAVLFIPDATVISTTIIQHVIKQLILNKIPAIGYNSFFSQAGSAMSFVVDYEKMGRQVANMAHEYLGEKTRNPMGPLFNIRINSRVVQLLKLRLNDNLPENVEFIK